MSITTCERCAVEFKAVGFRRFCTKTCSDRFRTECASGPTKQCGYCRKWLSKAEFYPNKCRPGVFNSRCKTCYAETRPRNVTTPTRSSWSSMIQRCHNPRVKQWTDYGGRGISVCQRWRDSFENFIEDMGERPRGMTIDRKDNDKGYELSNCRWASAGTQASNRRTTKLNLVAVCLIRHLHRRGIGPTTLSHAFGASKRHIGKIVSGETRHTAFEEVREARAA